MSFRFQKFKSSLQGLFASEHAQTLLLQQIVDKVHKDHSDIRFSDAEVQAACDRMTDDNQIMVSEGLVYLVWCIIPLWKWRKDTGSMGEKHKIKSDQISVPYAPYLLGTKSYFGDHQYALWKQLSKYCLRDIPCFGIAFVKYKNKMIQSLWMNDIFHKHICKCFATFPTYRSTILYLLKGGFWIFSYSFRWKFNKWFLICVFVTLYSVALVSNRFAWKMIDWWLKNGRY